MDLLIKIVIIGVILVPLAVIIIASIIDTIREFKKPIKEVKNKPITYRKVIGEYISNKPINRADKKIAINNMLNKAVKMGLVEVKTENLKDGRYKVSAEMTIKEKTKC